MPASPQMEKKYSNRYHAKFEKDTTGTYLVFVNQDCLEETDTTFSPARFSELFDKLGERDRKSLLVRCCEKGDFWNIKFLLENGVQAHVLLLCPAIDEADISTVRLLLKYVNTLESVGGAYHNSGILQIANKHANKGPLNMEIYHLIKAKYEEDLRKKIPVFLQMEEKYSNHYHAVWKIGFHGKYVIYVYKDCPEDTNPNIFFSPKRFPELAEKLTVQERQDMLLVCCQRRDYSNIKHLLISGTKPTVEMVKVAVSEADILGLQMLFRYTPVMESLGDGYHSILQLANDRANKGPLYVEIYDRVRTKFDEDVRMYAVYPDNPA